MIARAILVVALLLAPVALAQLGAAPMWTQPGGDMGRSSVADLSGRTLDIVRTFRFLEGEQTTAAGPGGLLETRDGVVGIGAAGEGACHLYAIDPQAGSSSRLGMPLECEASPVLPGGGPGAVALAVIPSMNAVLASPSTLTGAPLEMRSLADGSVVWSAGVERTPDDQSRYLSIDASYDAEANVVVVALASDQPSRARLVALEATTGRTLWSIPTSTLWRDAVLPGVGDLELGAAPTSEFTPVRVALMPNGMLVNGLFPSGNQATNPAGYVWLDRDGNVVGAEAFGIDNARVPDSRAPPTRAFSEWGATSGDRGAFVALGTLIVIDAESPTPRRSVLDAPADYGTLELAPPAWWQDKLLVPGQGRLFAFASVDLTPLWDTPWTAPRGAFILQVVIAPPGAVYVVSAVTLSSRNELTLHRLDLDTGEEIMRLPLPFEVQPAPGTFDGTMLPLLRTDEILVWTDDGQAALLSGALRPPDVSVSDDYPALGAPIEVTVFDERGDTTNVSIAWGDGEIGSATIGEPSTHQYDDARPRTLRATAFRADGTSATFERTIHVGETPPRELTAIQQAFEPENQNLTFFLIGLAVTGGAALFAGLLRRRRHSRLAEEEALLRKVVDGSLLDPTKGLAALEAHRGHLRDEHTRRRLDDAQFGLLDARTVRAMKAARYRMLGSSLNKLTPHFRRILDTALEDGQVTTGEMAALVQALEDEGALGPIEKEKLRALLSGWAR